jgi:cbb3-type cytochrome oxidase maturation protein
MLYVLIPLALMLLAVAVWALIWAARTGQFDDLESHGWSVVLDDDQRPPPDPEGEYEAPAGADEARDEQSDARENSTS